MQTGAIDARFCRALVALRLWRCSSLLALAPAGAARADDPIKGEVKAVVDGDYVRLMFQFDEPVEAKTRVSGAIIIVSFNKPVVGCGRTSQRQCSGIYQRGATRP